MRYTYASVKGARGPNQPFPHFPDNEAHFFLLSGKISDDATIFIFTLDVTPHYLFTKNHKKLCYGPPACCL